MSCFTKKEVKNPKFPNLSAEVTRLKTTEGGASAACAIMQEYEEKAVLDLDSYRLPMQLRRLELQKMILRQRWHKQLLSEPINFRFYVPTCIPTNLNWERTIPMGFINHYYLLFHHPQTLVNTKFAVVLLSLMISLVLYRPIALYEC